MSGNKTELTEDEQSLMATAIAIQELVKSGDAEVIGVKNGERRYRLTPKGMARVERLFETSAEARELRDQLRSDGGKV